MKKVLITGASGKIGSVVRKHLAKDYSLILFDRLTDNNLKEQENFIQGDITNFEEINKAAKGVDAIIHLAAVSDEQSFRKKICPSNIIGCHNVFEAARNNNVPRLIFASSTHTIGFYPINQTIDDKVPFQPDTMYGVSKCFGEAMGCYYAEKGDIEVVCLRIGSFQEYPQKERHLATWISHNDMVQLVRCSLEAKPLNFLVAYGVSNNTRNHLDNSTAEDVLGYDPEDNAEDYAEDLLEGPTDKFNKRIKNQGGSFTEIPFKP